MRNLRIDGDRLWQSLMDMARIGATEAGGSRRLALSDEDREGRDLFVAWCREAGCEVTIDSMGNIFARRPGRDPALPPVATGSHLDTQPHGGRFDGVYGVLAGLEVIRTLNDHDIETEAPVEVIVWTNEEGARFAPAMLASGVFAGVFDEAWAHSRADADGREVGDELARIGYAGEDRCGDHPLDAFFEVHIEQGPVLEREGLPVGVVDRVQGVRWYDVRVDGRDSHAGTTPMEARADALLAAAAMVGAVNRIAHEHGPHGLGTVGEFQVTPGSRNTIPGAAVFSVDLRHPDADTLMAMDRDLRAEFDRLARADGLGVAIDEIWYMPPMPFDPGCVAAVREAAGALGYDHRDIVSGAGHDAVHIARVAPTGMIFIPCENGLSHNEKENVAPDHVTAGGNVLLHAMLSRAPAPAAGD